MKTSTLVFLLAITQIHTAFAAVTGNITDGKTKAAVCAACHAKDGNSSDSTFPVLAGQHVDYIVKQLEEFKSGARQNAVMAPMAMPLSDQDRADLAAYFSSQIPKPRAADPASIELGKALYFGGDAKRGIPACMACHQPDGIGVSQAQFPRLSGQHPEYIASQLKMFRDGSRNNDMNEMMRDISMKLTDKDIDALSAFVVGLH